MSIDYLTDNGASDYDLQRRQRMRALDHELGYDMAAFSNRNNGSIPWLRGVHDRQVQYLRDKGRMEDELQSGLETGRYDQNYAANQQKAMAEEAAKAQRNIARGTPDFLMKSDAGMGGPHTGEVGMPKWDNAALFGQQQDQLAQQAAQRQQYIAQEKARRQRYLQGLNTVNGISTDRAGIRRPWSYTSPLTDSQLEWA